MKQGMKIKFLGIGISIGLMMTLYGCGGSSGGSASSTNGTVEGSFYEKAIVCFDTNGDGSCSNEFSKTQTDKNGNFTLQGAPNYPIIAEIKAGTIKHEVKGDNGVVLTSNDETIFAIPASIIAKAKIDGGGKVVISTLTTKLFTYAKTHPNASADEILEIVANSLGLEKDELLKDFNDPNVDEATRVRLKEKADILFEKIKGKKSLDEINNAVKDFVGSMKMPARIDVIKN